MLEYDKLKELFDSRDYEACLTKINKLKQEDLNSDILRIKGYALQRTEKFEEAMEVWNILLANNPTYAEFYAERAVCKFHLKFKSTLSDLDLAVEFDNENPYRYACRAFIKDKLGNTTGAIDDYKLALKLEPDNEVTLNNLGLLEEKLGYQSYAQMHYQQADALAQFRNSVEQNEPKVSDVTSQHNTNTDWMEVRKMVSSWSEFKRFVNDAITMLKPAKKI